MIKYKNVFDGKIIMMTAEEFEKKLPDLENYYEKLLNNTFKDFSVEFKERSNDIIYFNLKDKNNYIYRFALTNLKNSGDKKENSNNKRFYIYPNIKNYLNNNPYFLIGLYNAGDKIIHMVSEASEFVGNYLSKNPENKRSYSSFWFRFDQLLNFYESEESIILREKTAKNREHVYNVVFYDDLKIEFSKVLNLLNIKSNEKATFKLSDSVYAQERIVLLRNNQIRDIAFKNANHTCENCGKSRTFETKNGVMYFEAHHIIPFNISTYLDFDKTLDCIENLACLCPECHRKIHYCETSERSLMLKKLVKEKLIKKYNLKEDYIGFISKYYLGEDGENDE